MFNFENLEAFFISFGSLIAVALPAILAFIYAIKKIKKAIKDEAKNGINKETNLLLKTFMKHTTKRLKKIEKWIDTEKCKNAKKEMKKNE